MTDKEIKFIELYEKEILGNQNKSFPVIQQLHLLLHGEILSDCNSCVQRFFHSLAAQYRMLVPFYNRPVPTNEEFFKAAVATTEIKKLKKIHKQNIPDDGNGEAQNFIV